MPTAAVSTYGAFEKVLKDDITAKAKVVAGIVGSRITAAIDNGMPFKSLQSVEPYLDEIRRQNPEILFILVTDKSGRVLYEKDGKTPLANASTTKVLTCIVALESSPGDDYVQVSRNAASQPEVRLGLQKGEQYYLEEICHD